MFRSLRIFPPHQVSVGYYHSLALTENRQCYAFGSMDNRALGIRGNSSQTSPTIVTFFENAVIKQVSVIIFFPVFLKRNFVTIW